MDIFTATTALAALSHGTRLSVFRLLVKAGPEGLPATTIAARLNARQNTMSSHLKQLHQAGLVDAQRDGRRIVYSASYATMRRLILYLMQDCCRGEATVCGPVAESLAAKPN